MKLDLRAFKDKKQYDLEYCGGFVYFVRYPHIDTDELNDTYETATLEEVISLSADPNSEWNIDMYTGVRDDNNVKVYENDLIRWSEVYPVSQVVFKHGIFGFEQTGYNNMFVELDYRNYIVVGNIYLNKISDFIVPNPPK